MGVELFNDKYNGDKIVLSVAWCLFVWWGRGYDYIPFLVAFLFLYFIIFYITVFLIFS